MVRLYLKRQSLLWRSWLAAFASMTATGTGSGCNMAGLSTSLTTAVYNRDERRVRELLAARADLEERASDSSTPLLLATETDQFTIAEVLIDAGADIWATSEFGDSVGWAAEHSRVVRGAEADARKRILAKLRKLGFPFPAPHSSRVLNAIQAGQWPPKRT